MEKIGKVTHYYNKAGVAVIKLDEELKVGDEIKIEKGENSFEQTVTSIEKEYQSVDKGEKGEEVAVKVIQKAKEGSLVYK